MRKKTLEPGTFLFPVPSVMVSCKDLDGKANIITIAWVGTVNSQPPMVSISVRPDRYSYDMIMFTREFVVNIPDESLTWETDYCGTVSGREIDKFKETGLTMEESVVVNSPLIKEAPVNLECTVVEKLELGSHHLILGAVKKVHVNEGMLNDQGKLDVKLAKLISFGGKGYYGTGEFLLERGDSLKKKRG